MASSCAGRLNFRFLLLILAVISSLSADANSTTGLVVPESSKEAKPSADEELPLDKLNFISSTLPKDNLIEGGFNLSTLSHHTVQAYTAYAKDETDNLSWTETIRDFTANNESKPTTVSGTTYQHGHVAVETTASTIDDQNTNVNTDSSSGTKVDTTSKPVQSNTVQHHGDINLQFITNSFDDDTNNTTENTTASASTKPTKETIMGVGIKTVVSVSLRLKDTKIIGSNSSDVESSDKNSTFGNASDLVNLVPSNAPFQESIKNVTVTDSAFNETKPGDIAPNNSSEFPALNSTAETDLHNTEMRPNGSDTTIGETLFSTETPSTAEVFFNGSTEVHSDLIQESTNNNRSESPLNATEVNLLPIATETTGDLVNVSTIGHQIADSTTWENTTANGVEITSGPTPAAENNNTSSATTLPERPTSAILSSTSAEMANTTNVEIITTTARPIIRYAGIMKIVRGLSWNEELSQRQSRLFKKAASRVKSLLEDVFVGTFKEVEIDGFSRGSVLVDYYIILVEPEELDSDRLVKIFNSRFKNSTYGDFTIDPQVTQFKVEILRASQPTEKPRLKPFLPQWVVAVVVIAAASLVFIILFAAVTIYGRHYGRRSYNKKLQGDEIIFDKPDYQSGPRLSDAAYENLTADAVYDVESSPEKTDVTIGGAEYQFDSWRTNRLTRMSSSKRFSFNSS